MAHALTRCVPLALALAACDLYFGGGRDASAPDTRATACLDLRAQYQARLATLPDRCLVASDCGTVGGISPPTCNCAPSIGTCSGDPVSVGAARDPVLGALTQAFAAQCGDPSSGVPGTCDCAPAELACVDQRCVGIPRACFGPPDAPPPPDAWDSPDAW